MRAWLCSRGFHAWETWEWWAGYRLITRRQCTRRGCTAEQTN